MSPNSAPTRPPAAAVDESSLADAFRAQVRRAPEHPAVRDRSSVLTYRELDEASDRIAAALAARGGAVGSGLVGVLVDRSAATPSLLLGILKAGLAYVPLDPTYPEDRLRYIVEDSGLQLIVGDPEAVVACGLGDLPVLDPTSRVDGPTPNPPISPDDTAYVIYTSGSTGRPKGCLVTHGNVLSLLHNALPLFDVGETDRWTLFHSMSFDFSVWELWGALLSGGTAVCVPASVARAPEEMLELLARERITVLNQVPSVFRSLVRLHAATGGELALRYVVFGGESVDLGIAADFARRLGAAAPVLVNMYGITEITVHATFKILTADVLDRGPGSPIGKPLPHLEISIRDEQLLPVPDGEAGEILIAGGGVAAGYLNRPELTAERFVTLDSPDGPRRYYRSGDLARRDESGELEYLGRNDQQVKIRGFRVETGEIEAVLREHEDVADAAVFCQRSGPRQILAACVVARDAAKPPADLEARLRDHLAARLPEHMVPSRFRFEERLPLTASGKLDRRALAEMAAGRAVNVT